jgi:uncharacterized membrane protein YgdD (TMEM256/DUF423 family)
MNTNEKGIFRPKIAFWAGILGGTGGVLGAFGAHALKDRLADYGMTDTWETAVKYQLVHAVALLALAAWAEAGGPGSASQKFVKSAAWCWVAGVILFSGSLYVLALNGPHWLGPVTPLGGLALIAGWVLVAMAGWRK